MKKYYSNFASRQFFAALSLVTTLWALSVLETQALTKLSVEKLTFSENQYFHENSVSDGKGTVYVCGSVLDLADEFNHGSQPPSEGLEHSGGLDAYLARYDNGELIWARYWGSLKHEEFYSLAIATNGNVIAVGYGQNRSLVPGDAPDHQMEGDSEGVVVEFDDVDGSVIRANFVGGEGADVLTDVSIGPSGAIYVSGYTDSTQNIAGSIFPNAELHQETLEEATSGFFLARLNSFTLKKTWGSYFTDIDTEKNTSHIAAFPGDYTKVALLTRQNANENTSSLTTDNAFLAEGMGDVLAVFDTVTGKRTWATYLSSQGKFSYARDLDVDTQGRIFVVGSTKVAEEPYITPGAHHPVFGGSSRCGFIVSFDPEGALLSGSYFGTGGSTEVTSIDLSTTGSVFYLSGHTTVASGFATSKYNPAIPYYDISYNGGERDGFFAKIYSGGEIPTFSDSTYFGSAQSETIYRIHNLSSVQGERLCAVGNWSPTFTEHYRFLLFFEENTLYQDLMLMPQ